MKVEHRLLTNRNAQSSYCSIMRQCQAFYSSYKIKTFSVMVKVSHLLSFNCVSFADRRKTPRTKQQRQRKSLRKSARLSKSLEESCPTECCSVMWGSRVKLFFFFKLTYPLSKISRLIEIITILSFQLYRGFGGLDIWNHNGRSVAGLDVSYVLQVYTECWTTTQ